MSEIVVLVHDSTGRPLRWTSVPALAPGESLLVVQADGMTLGNLVTAPLMVSGGTLVPRPQLAGFDRLAIAADGMDAATLAGLPEGAQAWVDDVPCAIPPDGTLRIAATMPATYSVRVIAWPYQDYHAEIVAQ